MNRIETRVFARAGLLGNPSDGFGGKTISFSIGQYWASVWIEPSDELEIVPLKIDHNVFGSVFDLVDSVNRNGYYGAERLLKAAVKRFFEYCDSYHGDVSFAKNFRLGYESTIPRAVGLAGSSAIIIATLRALERFFEVQIHPDVMPSLALSVEVNELGIPAGLQDRVIQCRQGVVYMDFDNESMFELNGLISGRYESLAKPSFFEDLYVAFGDEAGQPTEVLHNDLRSRFDSQDPQVVDAMRQFAKLAQQGKSACMANDAEFLNQLIDANFDLRNLICALHPLHVEMIQVARSQGASAKYCGSGGAVVGLCSESNFLALKESMAQMNCSVIRPEWVEPLAH